MSDVKTGEDLSPQLIEARKTLVEAAKRPGRPPKKKDGEEGAKVNPTYHHRTEDYILVTHDDLREIKGMGGLQQALFGGGTFLFSGAFWLLLDLCAQQKINDFSFTAWMGMCIVSMIAGAILAYVGWRLFQLREARLNKYPLSGKPSEVEAKN